MWLNNDGGEWIVGGVVFDETKEDVLESKGRESAELGKRGGEWTLCIKERPPGVLVLCSNKGLEGKKESGVQVGLVDVPGVVTESKAYEDFRVFGYGFGRGFEIHFALIVESCLVFAGVPDVLVHARDGEDSIACVV